MAKEKKALGIDVSYANGKLDWALLRNKIDFAILRCGYGGDYPEQEDSRWAENSAACEKYGIPYGAYHYSYATSVEKAKSEAAHAIRLLKGKKLTYPVFYDLEESRIAALGKAKILEIAKTFVTALEKAGYVCGIYSSKSWFTDYLTDSWYDSKPKWLAQYYSEVTYKGSYDIWQYSSSGSFEGAGGYFDMNIDYTGFNKFTAADARKALRASAGLETLTESEKNRYDVNNDGKVTAQDARTILRKAAGLDGSGSSSGSAQTNTLTGTKTYSLKKDGETYLSAHFKVKEFKCKDGSDSIKINLELIGVLEELYTYLNAKAINITSGYRTPSHSVKVGGYSTDQHTKGNAADITAKKQDGSLFTSKELCLALEDLNHQGGVGRINTTHSVHVDVRGRKCWFDEVNGEKTTDSWYSYFGVKKK